MVFAAVNPRERVAGTSFENVAEEVLNGLFCHYEPPVSEYAQHKAASNARLHPRRYSFSKVKKYQSILRTSRLFKKKQAMESRKKKAVTWRDEHNRKGIEGHVEGCAADNCDFLGFSRKDGLADSISPTRVSSLSKVPMNNRVPEPIIKHAPTSREVLKGAPSKKILYDDEGNPINDDIDTAGAKNFPLSSPRALPPAPTGLTQLRQMTKELDDDIYEPEDYDNPHSSVSSQDYSQLRNSTPRDDSRSDGSHGDDKITMARSQSPSPRPVPNHYDTPEQFEDRGRRRGLNRPATPYRRRGESGDETEIEDPENSILNQENNVRSTSASPSRRSEVFSDLTMDDAISGRNNYRPASPARTSEGVEIDMFQGRARPRSRSPSRYRDDRTSMKDENKVRESTSSRVVFNDMGKAAGREAIPHNNDERRHPEESRRRGSRDDREHEAPRLSKKSSRDDRRRHSLAELPKPEEQFDVGEPRKQSSRSRRTSEPLPAQSKSRKSSNENDGFQKLRKVPSQSALPIVETAFTSEDENVTTCKRDPTPRMSIEPGSVDGPLPPTPRRKDDDRRSSREGHDVRRPKQEENRLRSRRDFQRDSQDSNPTSDGTPSSDRSEFVEGPKNEESTYDWAYNALMKQFTPKSMATDDEIRAEVSSVGMESNTLRPVHYPPLQYPNPFLKKNQPTTIKEERAPDLRPASSDDSEPSSISNSTISSHERQPVKKAKPAGAVGLSASNISGSTKHGSSKSRKKKLKPTHTDIQPSNSSASTRTKKLWKGWRKAVGKVKAIVKDIDEQRIPPPFPNPHLQAEHPTLGKSTHQHRRKMPSS